MSEMTETIAQPVVTLPKKILKLFSVVRTTEQTPNPLQLVQRWDPSWGERERDNYQNPSEMCVAASYLEAMGTPRCEAWATCLRKAALEWESELLATRLEESAI
jgi:hypothetical protein